ncbi:sulfotransferase [Methanocaldococcus infernus ME]|uniref:Sulfotransferase n=1 Tax=Methanocaldococcus infernus (strain DSM 11812 / JCM 15783 / ME) TaxID=573063 RepID=D5VQP0_METIM|nr:sulfotransferase [Methanocaldococcus infernus]ADG12893.1 sulfotransferase [Methanocaldococcus infernus ME]
MKDNTESKLPNFLIVGAAKSGTTSLYHYLKEHPEIYMSPIKEPKFITSNFLKFPFQGIGDHLVERSIIKTWEDYTKLFSKVKNEKAIGEASADTLYYYKNSIKYIKKYLGEPKIIIILRNPIDRAFSAYLHLLRDNREYLTFEEALKVEKKRIKLNWDFIWHYKNVGFYYKQVKAYMKYFSEVKIYLYDDLKKDTLKVVQDIYKFLEVNDSFVPTSIKIKFNVSGIPKNRFLHRFLTQPNPLKSVIKPFAKALIPKDMREKIMNKLIQINLEKLQMKPETRSYLKNLYRKDILRLQDVIERDLSHWLK